MPHYDRGYFFNAQGLVYYEFIAEGHINKRNNKLYGVSPRAKYTD
jgi:hypothetical protein